MIDFNMLNTWRIGLEALVVGSIDASSDVPKWTK